MREAERSGDGLGRNRWLLAIALALATVLAAEAFVPPSRQPTARLAVGAIRLYQATISPVLKCSGTRCRFHPTCSQYGVGAVERHGTLPGLALTTWRILRCGPWGPPPGEDLP